VRHFGGKSKLARSYTTRGCSGLMFRPGQEQGSASDNLMGAKDSFIDRPGNRRFGDSDIEFLLAEY
jgi:hypothetical protein